MTIELLQPDANTPIVNGHRIVFAQDIATVLPYPDRVVVLLDTD